MINHWKMLSVLVLLFYAARGFAQESLNESHSTEVIEESRSKFIQLSFGMSNSVFRDFATSPLFYRGLTNSRNVAFEVNSERMEREFGINYLSGNYNAVFNENKATSQAQTVTFYYSQLFQVKRLSTEKINLKAGGLIFATGNLRGNVFLQNNGRGIETFHSLMGSVKMSFDLSRKNLKEKKFLFFKYRLKPRKRILSFRINVGLVNSFFRNGYIYANQSSITHSGSPVDGYKFHLFAGQAYSTALDYTWYLTNHNAFRLSYHWKAYTTNEKKNKFDMAHHIFSLAFLFNTNNK